MEITIAGDSYGQDTEPLVLLNLLRRHLDQTLPDSVYLKPDQLLTLKGWLLTHAEQMAPGKALWLEETTDTLVTRLVAAIGKKEDGSTIVWHQPLPWPFEFGDESYKL